MDQESKKQDLLAKTSKSVALPAVESSSESAAAAVDESADITEGEKKEEPSTDVPKKHVKKPFQRLQFLVRDWQNFDKDYADEEDSPALFDDFLQSMQKYVNEVLRERNLADLQSTREQIIRCFEKVDCFQLPHPGSAVTRKNYDGTIKKIDPNFRGLVNRYVRYIFDDQLEPKEVNHRQITGRELKAYFEVYAKMFQTGEKTFPKAMTMLDATAEANNRNAYDMALAHYKKHMDLLVGEGKSFMKENELTTQSDQFYKTSLEIFDEIATMGSPSVIQKCRQTLVDNLENEKKRYFTTNALRNPFKDAELYVIPIAVAIVAWFLAVFTDKTCSTDFCERVEDTFVNVYLFIFFGLLIFAWKQVRGTAMYLKELVPLVVNHLNKAKN
jgi:atlastin